MKKKSKQNAETVTCRVGDITDAYGLLTIPSTNDVRGFSLSNLDTGDIMRIIKAIGALKSVADAARRFAEEVKLKFKPAGWDEILPKLPARGQLPHTERAEIEKVWVDYEAEVQRHLLPELNKETEIAAYEHISEEGFANLVKGNSHLLDTTAIMLLQRMLA